MTTVEIIRKILADWVEWVDADCPTNYPFNFSRMRGLCGAVRFHPLADGNNEYLESVLREMFIADNLHDKFPFNKSHSRYLDFCYEMSSGTIPINPNRITWARKQASQVA